MQPRCSTWNVPSSGRSRRVRSARWSRPERGSGDEAPRRPAPRDVPRGTVVPPAPSRRIVPKRGRHHDGRRSPECPTPPRPPVQRSRLAVQAQPAHDSTSIRDTGARCVTSAERETEHGPSRSAGHRSAVPTSARSRPGPRRISDEGPADLRVTAGDANDRATTRENAPRSSAFPAPGARPALRTPQPGIPAERQHGSPKERRPSRRRVEQRAPVLQPPRREYQAREPAAAPEIEECDRSDPGGLEHAGGEPARCSICSRTGPGPRKPNRWASSRR